MLHLETATSRLIRILFMVFRRKARTSQVLPIIGHEERPIRIFIWGRFLAVQGVSELHLCGRRGKNWNFGWSTASEPQKKKCKIWAIFLKHLEFESFGILWPQSLIHWNFFTSHFKAYNWYHINGFVQTPYTFFSGIKRMKVFCFLTHPV